MLGPEIWLWMRRALNVHVRYQVHISMAHEILPKYFNAVIYSGCKQNLILAQSEGAKKLTCVCPYNILRLVESYMLCIVFSICIHPE